MNKPTSNRYKKWESLVKKFADKHGVTPEQLVNILFNDKDILDLDWVDVDQMVNMFMGYK
jgi:hypothetical protein